MSEHATMRPSRRIARAGMLFVAVAAVLASAVYLIWKVAGIGNRPCGGSIGAAQQGALVVACVLAFAAGHRAQRFRHEERDPTYAATALSRTGPGGAWDDVAPGAFRTVRRVAQYVRTGGATRSSAWRTGSLITYGVLAVFYVCGLLALAYEAYALWPGTNVPSITSLVRCARNANVGWTIVVTATVSFLAGHWLWPRRPPHPEEQP